MNIEILRPWENTDINKHIKPSETVGKAPPFNQQEITILEFITRNGSIKSKDVKELLELKESRTRELLRVMVEKELIIRKGQGRTTYYTLKGI